MRTLSPCALVSKCCCPVSDAHYLTCRIQECAETTRSGPFARSIDISSLVVQDEYIFIQVSPENAVSGREGTLRRCQENEGGFPVVVKMDWGTVPHLLLWWPVLWGDPRLLVKGEGVMCQYYVGGLQWPTESSVGLLFYYTKKGLEMTRTRSTVWRLLRATSPMGSEFN